MKVGLIGNQNSGKTTLFNVLTGMNAKIGNWPGVTIEKKEGKIRNTEYLLTDLPGIYSLSPYTIEEEVARQYIFNEKPDVIINIVDSTCIERSLYLTTQLLELDVRVIVVLNMVDILEKTGIKINEKMLGQELGVTVLKVSALKEIGIQELIDEIGKESKNNVKKQIYDRNIEGTLNEIMGKLHIKHKRFVVVKLLEKDKRFQDITNEDIYSKVNKLENLYDTDLEEVIATQRYEYIEKVKEKCYIRIKNKSNITDELDKIFLNKFLSLPIFIFVMFLVYYFSVGVIGKYTIGFVNNIIENFSNIVENILIRCNVSDKIISLILDGIISGVGAVLNFIPQLAMLFLCISLLETTGYMSRIALLLDRIFRKIGLSGKSLIAFIVGSGCSVPGIIGTRIIENNDEREITSMLVPFIPCSAKLPIIALFSGYFFENNVGMVSFSLYCFAILVIICSAYLLSKLKYSNISSGYVAELPEYKLPNLKYVIRDVLEKVKEFIKRAGSIILICSIILWFLLSYSINLESVEKIEDSILASFGKSISWMFYPMLGENNWGATVSAIQGIIAKEQVVSSMNIISGISEKNISNESIFNNGGMFSNFTKSSAYAYMVFNLFSAPCISAIATMKKELKSWKKLIFATSYQIMLAWILATLVYQIGSRLEKGIISILDIIIVLVIVFFVLFDIIKNIKYKGNRCTCCPYIEKCR